MERKLEQLLFVVKEKLVSFDYSQIELRLAVEISGDKNFIKAFKNNEDIHRNCERNF